MVHGSMNIGAAYSYSDADVHGALGCDQKSGDTSSSPSPYPTAACSEFHEG